jgi:hypothetical protein
MIELDNDTLRISFPKIGEELRKLSEDFFLETLPGMLGENRDAAFDEAVRTSDDFRRLSPKESDELRRLAHELTKDRIADVLRQTIRERVSFNFTGNTPAEMSVGFQRTLRIPDDGKDYHLPPGLGEFPLRHLDDFAERVPASWRERGGVLMPMYQAEALWLNFDAEYPFAVKVASGKINAITGEGWRSGLNRDPQDYLVLPEQPWLDGFSVAKGIIRQFVAMPLGAGYSVEEQLTGKAEFGGIQLQVFPMKAEVYFREEILPGLPTRLAEILPELLTLGGTAPLDLCKPLPCCCCAASPMGLGAGGRMKQEIYQDKHAPGVWDLNESSRCFVHLCNSLVWREITGTNPPHPPVTAKEYQRYGYPWFDFYRDDVAVLDGSEQLAGVQSVVEISKGKGDSAVLGNDSVQTKNLIDCGPKPRPNQVKEWTAD